MGIRIKAPLWSIRPCSCLGLLLSFPRKRARWRTCKLEGGRLEEAGRLFLHAAEKDLCS